MTPSTIHRPLPSIVVELGRVPEVDLRAGLGGRRFEELVRSGTLLPPQARPRPERDDGRGEARDASWLDRLWLAPSSQDEAE